MKLQMAYSERRGIITALPRVVLLATTFPPLPAA
jgi:hypothetical protein